jgi:PKD repeat protein
MIPVNKLPHIAFLFLAVSLSSCVDDEPKASFMVEQDPENKPLYATFTSTSKHAESLRWSIEGNYVTSPLLEYRFTEAGTYTVELEITNDDGETDRVTQQVEIPFVDPCGDSWLAKDQAVLDQYFTDHSLTPLRDELGRQYVITQAGNGKKVTDNYLQIVDIRSSFYSLDGTLVYQGPVSSDEWGRYTPEARAAIKALEEGAKANFFLPSCQAFGAKSFYDVPPYTPLILQVEIIRLGGIPCQC